MFGMTREVIRVRPGKQEHNYGLAIDVGTTTVAAYFCDLTNMEVIDTVSMMNPQCKYGEDVMARITYHMTTPDGLQRMSDDIIEGTNELIDKAIANTFPPKKKVKKKKGEEGPDEYVEVPEEGKTYLRLTREDIEDITIGFNTAMHHIFLSLNPGTCGEWRPFRRSSITALDIRAQGSGHQNKSPHPTCSCCRSKPDLWGRTTWAC